MFGKCSEAFASPSDNFWRIFGKSRKTPSLVRLYNKQNITCPLVDTNFIFSCSTRFLTRSPHSLVRYRVEHEKIKFVSFCGHVISSIYYINTSGIPGELARLNISSHVKITCYFHKSKGHLCFGYIISEKVLRCDAV